MSVRPAAVWVAVMAATVSVVAGCGGSTPAPTSTVADGTTVDASRYLADSAAGAAATRAFASALESVGAPATPARLRAVSVQLEPPLASARLVGQRLAAERLADRRLDEQRGRNAVAFGAIIAVMERVQAAAEAGDPAGTRAASQELAVTIEALRDATPPG